MAGFRDEIKIRELYFPPELVGPRVAVGLYISTS